MSKKRKGKKKMENKVKNELNGTVETIGIGKNVARLSPPWIQYVNAVNALFAPDDEITTDYEPDEMVLTLRVRNHAKADALSKLLPGEKMFGNIGLKIRVVPANDEETDRERLLTAFSGNPALRQVVDIPDMTGKNFCYAVFRREVVQYFNDDLSDPLGNRSTLYQELAKEVLGNCHCVFFCTERK